MCIALVGLVKWPFNSLSISAITFFIAISEHGDINTLHGTYEYLKSTGQVSTTHSFYSLRILRSAFAIAIQS